MADPLQPHPPLQPAMTASIQYVLDGAWGDDGGAPGMGGPWDMLTQLLHGGDPVDRQRARGWMLVRWRVLMACVDGLYDGSYRWRMGLIVCRTCTHSV